MKFEVVIGSWGSYNARNKRSLGSDWIDLAKYNSWKEIEEELKKQGFELDGMDEELFIQDMDFRIDGLSGDSTNPKFLFNILKTSGVLENDSLAKEMFAYIEAVSWDDFCDLVEEKGDQWDSDIIFSEGADSYDWAYDSIKESLDKETFSWLSNYIDFEKYANDCEMNNTFKETSYGIIEFIK